MIIEIQNGDATSPKPQEATEYLPRTGIIIGHIANSIGAWGAGFVLALNKLSLAPKNAYKALSQYYVHESTSLPQLKNSSIPLGITQFVEIEPDLWVANMIAQKGINKNGDTDLVDYDSLYKCLKTVFSRAILLRCNVSMPAGMGSGLAGGKRETIHSMIKNMALSGLIVEMEKQMKFIPKITLWEFPVISTSVSTVSNLVNEVDAALKDFRGIDLDI